MSPGSYLAAAGRRLRLLALARGAALTAAALAAVTLLGAWILMAVAPAAATVSLWRVLLYGALVVSLAVLVWRRQGLERTARVMEKRIPPFQGRLVTWLDTSGRGPGTPLLELLTRETSAIAAAHPVEHVVPARQLIWPAAAALAAAGVVVALFLGSHPLQVAAQRLWTGNLLAGAQPRILVSPGDVVVRRGSDVVVDARAHGFRPGNMEVHAAFGAGGWERAPMSATGEAGFGFVFMGVAEEIEYYVSARGLTSGRHHIRVADLPRVTRVETTHHLPAWTGRAPVARSGGDVTVLPGTRVEVAVVTDPAVAEAVLVVNDVPAAMAGDGRRLRGSFEVTRAGRWHVAVRHAGGLARISDTYLIEVAEDHAPEVAFTFPGHDRKATPIEEVALAFEAHDDYGVEALELRYAVNGGEWIEVPLEGGAGGHLLALESLTVEDGAGRRGLAPGDVISLYAEARDHARATRTALYFVDVRPFDTRYRESQQMGSQGGSEGGGLDIAERQRTILSATWNLINRRDELEPQALRDQAGVLAMLQRTLRDQVETVVARSQARGLGGDDEVSQFLAELGRAQEHMEPAAQRLERLALADAVAPEQQALRHLVTAEASVRDVDVSLARDDGRGTSGRSLGELLELEMDRERNRYEVPQQAGLAPDGSAGGDADWRRLEELAARQERLARQRNQGQDSLPSRWEQARLSRELEALRRDMQSRLSRQRSEQGGQPRQGSGAPGAQNLERAISDLSRAEEALARDADPRAAHEAGEALRRAARTLRESSRGDLQERLSGARRRAANLEADQERVMEALERLQQSALEDARNGRRIGRSDYAMQTFGAVKRRMQEDLAQLRGELTGLSQALGERDPDGARLLDRALRELDEVRVDERLAASAEAFEVGQPLYVIGSETLVEQALERLATRIADARESVTRAGAEPAADPLTAVRELRRRLDAARDGVGGLAADEVAAVARSIGRLAPDADLRQDGSRPGPPGPVLDPEVYVIRGIADENTEVLYRMTLERLDLLEAALESADSPPVRAQDPRDAARDSAAAARYFRDLSRRTMDDD